MAFVCISRSFCADGNLKFGCWKVNQSSSRINAHGPWCIGSLNYLLICWHKRVLVPAWRPPAGCESNRLLNCPFCHTHRPSSTLVGLLSVILLPLPTWETEWIIALISSKCVLRSELEKSKSTCGVPTDYHPVMEIQLKLLLTKLGKGLRWNHLGKVECNVLTTHYCHWQRRRRSIMRQYESGKFEFSRP